MPVRAPKKPRILVVEDDEAVRTLEAVTLRDAGYVVKEAGSGEEALSMLRAAPFDLVLLDLMMPGIDGYEVVNRLRGMPKRGSTPVIVVTARGREQEGMLREATEGVDDHVDKPFAPGALEDAVKIVLAKSPVELEAARAAQSRAVGVYEAIIELREATEERRPEVRAGFLRRRR